MGRIKRGLDYFPMSIGFMHDRMVHRIMKREGDAAFTILVETLSYIYAGEGYYISADNEFYEELVDSLYNTDIEGVKRVIALGVKYGLFDAELFRRYNILTSADIQRQYLFITKRRSGSLIEDNYCLLKEEELDSYRPSARKKKKDASDETENEEPENGADAVAKTGDVVDNAAHNVAFDPHSATMKAEMYAMSTQNKEKQNKTKENNLPNPPQTGGDGGGKILKGKKTMTQEDIDSLQPPCDGVQRNFQGLMENLRTYRISPSEQYAILLKSNFGAIGNPVWRGLSTIRGSNGKIKLPGHYLLSVMN